MPTSRLSNLIHAKLKIHQHDYFKAKALVWLQVSFIIINIIVKVSSTTLEHSNNDSLFWLTTFLAIISIFYFKYKGNLILTGNFVAFLVILTLFPGVLYGGGLLSDNLLWCSFVPMVALLFADVLSGLIWLLVILIFNSWLFFYEIYPLEQLKCLHNPASYYYIGNSIFFFVLFAIINIFRYEQHRLIQSLVAQNILLEAQKSEISKKTLDLEATTLLLENSNKELEQFAYVASHDLKEPLRMISMYTQMIQRRLKGVLEGETEEFMGFVTDGVKRMQQMLEDLLDYSRLGKNQNIVRVDLNDTLFLVQQNLKVTINEKNATIQYVNLPAIYAVSSEITQLFQNLIGNALKFHHTARIPKIDIGIQDINTESFTITIKDNGIGIPQDSKLRIFNLFERLHNRTEYQGTGIGLATCRKVMDNLGGSIWVESQENEGSTFYIKFPSTVLEAPKNEE